MNIFLSRFIAGPALLALGSACALPDRQPTPEAAYGAVASALRERLGPQAVPMLVPDTVAWLGLAELLESGIPLPELEQATGFGVAVTDIAGLRPPHVFVDFGPLERAEGDGWRIPARLLVPYPGLEDRRMLDDLAWEFTLACAPEPEGCEVTDFRETNQAEWEVVEAEPQF